MQKTDWKNENTRKTLDKNLEPIQRNSNFLKR